MNNINPLKSPTDLTMPLSNGAKTGASENGGFLQVLNETLETGASGENAAKSPDFDTPPSNRAPSIAYYHSATGAADAASHAATDHAAANGAQSAQDFDYAYFAALQEAFNQMLRAQESAQAAAAEASSAGITSSDNPAFGNETSYAPAEPIVPAGFDSISHLHVSQAINNAHATRNTQDAQVAMLMMLMVMMMSSSMSSGGSGGGGMGMGGGMDMLMPMMSSMLQQLEADTNNAVRATMLNSGHNPAMLGALDQQLFFASAPAVSATGQAIIPVEAWRPVTPAIVSTTADRNPALYRAVVNQFMVESAERYRPFRNGFTYCNIFVWDVTRAMGAEIPFFVDAATCMPMQYPNTGGSQQQTALRMERWLEQHGAAHGWREVDSRTAQMHANTGRPAMTTAGTLDHVQMVIPSNSGGYDPVRGVAIAQAGRIVSSYMYITGIYSPNAMNNYVRYWIHD